MGLTSYVLWLAQRLARPLGWPPPTTIELPPTATGHDLAREEIRLPLPGGETRATLWTPPDARGAVVLCHAGAVTRDATWPWAAALARAGLASLAPDLDGHGENSRLYTSVAAAGEALPPAMRALRERGLARHLGLLGASLGGVIALRGAAVAARDGTLTPDALALLATPHAATFGQLLTLNTLRAVWDGHLLPGLAVRRAAPRSGRALFEDSLAAEGILDTVARLRHSPLLLVHGQHDPYAPPRQGAAIRAAHGHAEMWTIPLSHAGTMYDTPTLARVAAWLAARLTA